MKKISFILTLVFVFCIQNNVSAQGPGGPGGNGTPCGPPFGAPCIPVDNGIVFLIVAGVLLAAKTIYDFSKKSKTIS